MSMSFPMPLPRQRVAALTTAAGVSAGAAAVLPPAGAGVITAVAVTLLFGREFAPSRPRDHALRRHLAICRRREERALVLVASTPGRHRSLDEELRISDSAISGSRRGGSTLVAVIDWQEQSRERISQRLLDHHGPRLDAGWAAFPEDGMTLDALVEVASSRLQPLASPETGHLTRRPTEGRR